ncbi:uncharacterized protein F5891DRAFT_1190620 [Suillus fuscotomentosus]|uniref:DUF6532 domain-containing protein n=1 Tax=Suillus fuscotomentosus TaxID=1912939 RepID=A0AAD4E589_9AGAM|nr:uncharacterized protein F5891DRAFT_1190620 [Suillus fuscotomentosus]KAG1898548.1 hypothetical protein F5891DRAFT_1190620 [Suillus fuscotomentosus]
MSGWGDQLLQADIDQQFNTHDPPGPHTDFDFTYSHQLNDNGTYQTQSAWIPPQPQLPHAHLASSISSTQAAASHHSLWAPHQHWQGIHGSDTMIHHQSWPLSPQGVDFGQGLPEPVIAHPVPQRLYYRSGPQHFFATWQPPPSPTACASSPPLGPNHQPDQPDGPQPEAPVLSVNPSVFDNTSYHPNLSSPSRSSHQIFDDISQHAALTAPRRRRRVPQEQTSSRSAKRAKTQTRSSTQFTIIPYRSEMMLDRCIHSMKLTAFKTSLLPTDIDHMVDAACRAVVSQQVDETLRYWVLDKLENDKEYFRTRLEPELATISGSMAAVVQTFVYIKYGLGFNYATAVNGTHIAERTSRANHLVQNDTFLYGTLHVNGDNITVTFANPTIIALVGYLLRDSEHQFHRYISDNLNYKPLLAMTATLCLWVLQERITGICVPVRFLTSTHRVHHDRFVSLLEDMSAMELTALTQILTNGSALSPPVDQ